MERGVRAELMRPTQPRSLCWAKAASICRVIFPFLKLRSRTAEPFWKRCCGQRHPRPSERFFSGLLLWIIAVFTFCYMFLTISSTTFLMKRDGDKYVAISKFPACGRHISYFMLSKRVVEVLLMHHLCGNLMQPLEEMYQQRYRDLELNRPLGPFHWFQRVVMRRRESQEKWLSSFFPDVMLLLAIGICAFCYVWQMLRKKVDFKEFQEISDFVLDLDAPSWPILLADTIAYVYTITLVIGFLLTTLESNVVAIACRQREYFVTLFLFMVLWGSNFLMILFDRTLYTSAWGSPASAPVRTIAAASQVFITHSSVMLGAVLAGHSAHLRRTPDMTWNVCLTKMVPSCVVLVAIAAWSGLANVYHQHPECYPTEYHLFSESWAYFIRVLPGLGGSCLLMMSQLSHDRGEDEDDSDSFEFMSALDYDSTLIALTVALAVIMNANSVFEMEASRIPGSTVVAVTELLAPLGLSTFTFHAWKSPPRSTSSARSAGLWLGLVCLGEVSHVLSNICPRRL
ncbi:unnamed protein product [Effrenium voratum]|uniref:Uncharacterized protein n=1 Tax=Effrenium voratum TaxID=2562239 RepID=A0AA36NK04_9DINO|nr:unnamed protein product [Effrenium voratum]